ncbi:MAG: AraC family transcriptional regulator [Clostridia bacterium]|nr:AraC family transcriptional regulator [Clostridia bacterium]
MKLSELVKEMDLNVVTGEIARDCDISGVYMCDLLSRVMSRASEDGIWITVMAHVNIVAVAELVNLACIMVPEGIAVQQETIEKAKEENITIVSTGLTGYEAACRLHDLLD